MHDPLEICEIRLFLRWAAQDLSANQRAALAGFMADRLDREVAAEIGITKQGVSMIRQHAFAKMRRRLNAHGLTTAAQFITDRERPDGWVEPAEVEVTLPHKKLAQSRWRASKARRQRASRYSVA